MPKARRKIQHNINYLQINSGKKENILWKLYPSSRFFINQMDGESRQLSTNFCFLFTQRGRNLFNDCTEKTAINKVANFSAQFE